MGDMKTRFAVRIINWNQAKMNETSQNKNKMRLPKLGLKGKQGISNWKKVEGSCL